MAAPLWVPSTEQISQSNMMSFINYCNVLYKTNFRHYDELYEWSLDYSDRFWGALFTFCNVKHSQFCDEIVVDRDQMQHAKWFIGAELNFAENLLRHQDNKIALIFRSENGARKTLTYKELYIQVAQLAAALRKKGVRCDDRIAGWMPNCIEAVVAMLATTSIGAIWTSC